MRPRFHAPLAVAVLVAFSACACGNRAEKTTATTDVASTAPVRVVAVDVGRGLGADRQIAERTNAFKPTETVYAVVTTEGTNAGATLTARWTFEDGQLVEESTHAIQSAGTDYTEFHVSKPDGWPKGKYTVEILLDGKSVERRSFDVGGA